MAHDPRVLGGGDFVAAVWKEAEVRVKRQVKRGERRAAAEQVIKEFCEKAGIREAELRGGGQRRKASGLRGGYRFWLE